MKGKSRIVFCRMGGDGKKTRARDIPRFARNDGCLRVARVVSVVAYRCCVSVSIGERRTTTYQLRYLRLRRTELPKEVPRRSVLHSSPD